MLLSLQLSHVRRCWNGCINFYLSRSGWWLHWCCLLSQSNQLSDRFYPRYVQKHSSLFIILNTATWLLFLTLHPESKIITSHLFVMSFISWPHLANQCVSSHRDIQHVVVLAVCSRLGGAQLSFSVTYLSVTPLSSQWTLLGPPRMTDVAFSHMWMYRLLLDRNVT